LLDFIDKKVKNLEDEKNEIKKIIPSLLAKQKTQEKTQYSRVFEGFRGLRALFQELFNQNPKKEVMVFGLDDMLSQAGFVSFFNFYHELRKNKRIVTKIIFQKSVKKIIDEKYSSNVLYSKMDKVKYLDIVFPTGVFIFEDHVITIVSEKNITAFDIKSGQNTERYRQFFNSIWKN
ncbi:MAG: hypothetical protein Q8N88_00910, partial [Nanoarchaeota archaeon]|nr:hypothetical protein [Nanoarchaeota archaeon]